MNLLLDTHVLLWWLDDHPSLSVSASRAIADTDNLIIISAAVIWEIRIKQALGKLEIEGHFYEIVKTQGFALLPITSDHAFAVGDLPAHHRDPFDRILIAQAMHEGCTLLTHDPIFSKYPVQILRT